MSNKNNEKTKERKKEKRDLLLTKLENICHSETIAKITTKGLFRKKKIISKVKVRC